jgi:hypothetical protein
VDKDGCGSMLTISLHLPAQLPACHRWKLPEYIVINRNNKLRETGKKVGQTGSHVKRRVSIHLTVGAPHEIMLRRAASVNRATSSIELGETSGYVRKKKLQGWRISPLLA